MFQILFFLTFCLSVLGNTSSSTTDGIYTLRAPNQFTDTRLISTRSSVSSNEPVDNSQDYLTIDQPIIDQPIISTFVIVLDSPVLIIPNGFDGTFITAPEIRISGSLTVDLSHIDIPSEFTLQLFSTNPEKTFQEFIVTGLSSCSVPELGSAGQLYVINTCTSSSSKFFLF